MLLDYVKYVYLKTSLKIDSLIFVITVAINFMDNVLTFRSMTISHSLVALPSPHIVL